MTEREAMLAKMEQAIALVGEAAAADQRITHDRHQNKHLYDAMVSLEIFRGGLSARVLRDKILPRHA